MSPMVILNDIGPKTDGSLKKQVYDFLQKLQQNPASPSLHIEPVHSAADRRIRTGRVNDQFRAVLLELRGSDFHQFMYLGTWNHDDAYRKAPRIRLDINPVNGIPSVVVDPTPEDAPAPAPDTTQVKDSDRTPLHGHQDDGASPETGDAPGTVPAPVPGSPALDIVAADFTPETIEQEIGVSPTVTRRVLATTTESEFAEELKTLPRWVADTFEGLAAGFSVEEIRDELSIEILDEGELPDVTDDADVIRSLQHPAARMEFDFIENDEDLRRAIEDEDFNAWRVYLHPSQQKLAEKSFNGSARVTGGAGTGKTVVALHRANNLVLRKGDLAEVGNVFGEDRPAPAVLLTTYTTPLSTALKAQMNQLNRFYPEASTPGEPGLWIAGIDKLIWHEIKLAPQEDRAAAAREALGITLSSVPQYLSDKDRDNRWQESLDQVDTPPRGEAAGIRFLAEEYETVVIANGITDLAGYLRVPRPGRGTALNRAARKQVWSVIETFLAKCGIYGTIGYAAMAALGARILENRAQSTGHRLFDHIVIDEAQDFHAGHWRFLRAAVAEGPNDIFLAEDSHQRIYGAKLVLSRFGIETRGRSRRLTLNYRTTRENLGYAVQILNGSTDAWTDSSGDEDPTSGYRSVRSGPRPQVLTFPDEGAELSGVVDVVRDWTDSDPAAQIGVLARTNRIAQKISDALHDRDLAGKDSNVSVVTMHKAKGLEFNNVVLVGIDDRSLPLAWSLKGLGQHERDDEIQKERALLYVAASRARDALVITVPGQRSTLLP